MRRSGSGSGCASGSGSGSGSAWVLQLLALVCWAVLLGRAEDDELTVEESTERTREKEELRIATEQLERELGRHHQKLKRTVHQADMGAEGG